MNNIHHWIQYLEETFYFNWTPGQLLQFYVEQFRDKNQAMLNLDYALMEMYSTGITGGPDLNSDRIIVEARKIGHSFFKHLEKLGCFSKEKLDYCFAKVIDNDTFLLWRPDESDVHSL